MIIITRRLDECCTTAKAWLTALYKKDKQDMCIGQYLLKHTYLCA